jgi:hypothetical protein
MTTQSLFRVLERDQQSREFLLLELAETTDGTIAAMNTDPIRVSTESDDDDVEYILELLSPGHLLYATLDGPKPYEIIDIEHHGGVTLELLDPWLPPYLALNIWHDRQERENSPQQERVVELITEEDNVDPLSTPTPVGEITLIFTDKPRSVGSKREFFRSGDIESFLQEFEEMAGDPMEVLAADPHGLPFWCVLAFDSEQSSVAQKVRAQYGSRPNEEFIPNPLFNIHDTTGQTEEPTNPDQNPRQVIGNEYQGLPEDMIPDKTGQGTLKLIRELIAMADGFSLRGFAGSSMGEDDSPSLQSVSTFSPSQYSNVVETIGDALIGYIRLTMQIYQTAESSSKNDPEALVNEGILPNPELLMRADQLLRQYLALHQGFTQKMESVDIRDYVPDIFGSYSEAKQRELKKKHPHLEPLPETLETLVDQQRNTLEIFEINLEDCKKIVDVDTSGPEVQYAVPLISQQSTKGYDEFADIREEMVEKTKETYHMDPNNDGFDDWVDQLLFGQFSNVDVTDAKYRSQARFEWFGAPEIDFTSFRTV